MVTPTPLLDPESAPPAPSSEPYIDEKTLKIRRGLVRDCKQAFTRCTLLREQRREANKKNAIVERNYQGAPPFDVKQLQNAGQGWRRNFSTRPLATIVERSAPTYVAAVNAMASLTQSRLRDQSAEGQRKTAKGREIVTRMIRGWLGWADFVQQVAMETCKMGYCAAIRWDSDWRPAALRQGEFAVDKDALQEIDRLAEICCDRALQPSELYKLVIEDPETAADAGWDVEAVAQAINVARPASQYRDNNPREIVEQERQDTGVIQSDVPVVEVIIYLYADLDGSVSKYILRRDDGKKLFFSKGVEKRMAHAVRLFSSQQGTGKLYSSQGLGRMLVNLAMALDQIRCEFLDAIKLVSRGVLKEDTKTAVQTQVTVGMPFIHIIGEATLESMPIDLPVEAYLAADKALVGFMEVIAGAYLPSDLMADQKPKTATEAAQTAQREDAIRGNLVMRHLGQMAGVVEMIQRAAFTVETIVAAIRAREAAKNGARIARVEEAEMLALLTAELDGEADIEVHQLPDGVDESAVMACIDFLEAGFTAAEIIEFVHSPTADPQRQAPQALGQQLRAIAAAYPGSPLINHQELARMDVQQIAGPDVADRLVLRPLDMEANKIEAGRLQVLEFGSILAGEDVKVSPLDDHATHFAVYKTKAAQLFQAMSNLPALPNPQIGKALQNLALHGAQHLLARENGGEKGEQLREDRKFQQEVEKGLADLMERTQQAEQQRQAAEQQAAAQAEIARVQQETLAQQAQQQQAQPAAPAQPAQPDQIPPEAFDMGIPAEEASESDPLAVTPAT